MNPLYIYNSHPRNPQSHLNRYLREALRYRDSYTFLLF